MRARLLLLATGVVALLASACTSDDVMRIDGVTPYAGDAIAANTVMQMVDPWQYGVQDTNLKVPHERPATASSSAGSSAGRVADSGGAGSSATPN